MVIKWVSKDEKLRIKYMMGSFGYPYMSDFIRNHIFRRLDKKVISLDENTSYQLKELNYELNKLA